MRGHVVSIDTKVAQVAAVLAVTLLASVAFGAASGMPWEGPIEEILNSVDGPIARALGVVSLIFLGFAVAFSDGGTLLRKGLWVGVGLALAFSATSWGVGFFGFAGGLLV